MSLSGVALVWSAAAVILIFREMARVKREKQGLGAPVRRAPLLQGPEVAERAATFGLKLTRYDEHVSVHNEGRGTLEAELGPGAALCLQVGGSLEVVTEVLISGLPGELRLRSSRGPREHPIGDPSFDSLFAFDGTLWSTRGALTPSARSALRELLLLGGEGASLSLSQGQLRLKPGSSGASALAQSHLPALLQQARLLVAELRPQPGEGWLRDAARHDPVAGVRAGALRELLEAPLIPDVRALLAGARQDPADEVRLLAGLALADRAVLDEVSDGVLWDEVARREA